MLPRIWSFFGLLLSTQIWGSILVCGQEVPAVTLSSSGVGYRNRELNVPDTYRRKLTKAIKPSSKGALLIPGFSSTATRTISRTPLAETLPSSSPQTWRSGLTLALVSMHRLQATEAYGHRSFTTSMVPSTCMLLWPQTMAIMYNTACTSLRGQVPRILRSHSQ
jgi:hypothetical protein